MGEREWKAKYDFSGCVVGRGVESYRHIYITRNRSESYYRREIQSVDASITYKCDFELSASEEKCHAIQVVYHTLVLSIMTHCNQYDSY